MKAGSGRTILSLMKVTLLSAVLILIPVNSPAQEEKPEVRQVDAGTVKAWLDENVSFTILDVRTVEERESFGYPTGSINISYYYEDEQTSGNVEDPAFLDKVKEKVDKNARVMLICNGGYWSGRAAARLQQAGYDDVYVFENGIRGSRLSRTSFETRPGWMASDLPFVEGNRSYAEYSIDDEVQQVEADTVRKWLDEKTPFLILDVRTEEELEKYGYPRDSYNVSLDVRAPEGSERRWVRRENFVEMVSERAGKNDRIVCICTLSWRAAMAAKKLQEAGFTSVFVFHHGIQGRWSGREITKGWRAHGLPYVEASDSADK